MVSNRRNYYTQRDADNMRKISDILETLPEFCREYLVGIENNTTTLTRLNYTYDIRLFLFYLVTEKTPLVGKPIKEITLQDISSLNGYEIEKYLSFLSYYEDHEGNMHANAEKGKARKLSSIKAMVKYFERKETIEKDPTAAVRVPKIHQKEIVRLEGDEIAQILDVAETGEGLSERQKSYHENTKIRDTAIVALLLGTGIRVSELVGLDLSSINFSDASFVVTRKGGNRSILYFSQEVGGMIYDYYQMRTANKMVASDQKAFFLSLQNTRITTRAVQNIVKKYSKIVSPLKKITPHKLRSTYGTELYRQTGDIYIVADVLGHKDVNTTKKHYAAISEDLRRKASKQVTLRFNPDDENPSGK